MFARTRLTVVAGSFRCERHHCCDPWLARLLRLRHRPYNHVLAGYVIDISGHQFVVEEACRGVQTLFALVAMAAILAVRLRRPLVHGALLVASAVFWAIAVNVIRARAKEEAIVDHARNGRLQLAPS